MFLFSVPASAVLRLQSYSKNSIPPNIFARIFQENLITIDNQHIMAIKNFIPHQRSRPDIGNSSGQGKTESSIKLPYLPKKQNFFVLL